MWMIGHLFSLRGVYARSTGRRLRSRLRHARGARALVSGVSRPSETCGFSTAAFRRGRRRQAGDDRRRRAGRRVTGTALPTRRSSRPGARCAIGSAVRRRRSSTRGATPSTTAKRCARSEAGRFPAPSTSSGNRTSTPDGRSSLRASCGRCTTRLGVTPDREVVTYCQGGYRAAHTLCGAEAGRVSRTCGTTPDRGRNGAIATTCPSSARGTATREPGKLRFFVARNHGWAERRQVPDPRQDRPWRHGHGLPRH